MNTTKIPQFLLAAPTSGSGKTTICRGIMAALAHGGKQVYPYKCGPDYIDTKFHGIVCRRPSLNLDTFMASESHVVDLYAQSSEGADCIVVEGMMGLFDGYNKAQGSSATIAKLLHLPVVLVVDARSMAYSMAPLLKGFLEFDKEVDIAGVIFNRVGSSAHFKLLESVCQEIGVPCFGYVSKSSVLETDSRYLGLDFSTLDDVSTAAVLNAIVAHIDLDALLAATMRPLLLPPTTNRGQATQGNWNISVARNSDSFSFIYQEHLDLLKRYGTVRFFDPEIDSSLPEATDLLYLPGGYPEKHAAVLAKNGNLRRQIKQYIEQGGKALAECGGMIYLCDTLELEEGTFTMCGVVPFHISNCKPYRKLSLGYRTICLNDITLKGHEFHYTQITDSSVGAKREVGEIRNAREEAVPSCFYRYKNLFASYIHLYWGELDLTRLFETKSEYAHGENIYTHR